MSQPPIDDEQIRERQTYTASAGDDDERVSRKVVYEHSASTGGSRNFGVTIGIILVLALVLIGYILMHMHH
jgi:hypothetical protein